MKKDTPRTRPTKDARTPFQKFDALAKRVIRAPKAKADGKR
jgi:hypothetical protein